MGDWLLDNFGWILLAAIVALLALMFVAFSACGDEKRQHILNCKQAGKPEYECVAMFQHYCSGGGGTYVAPVVIGGGRR